MSPIDAYVLDRETQDRMDKQGTNLDMGTTPLRKLQPDGTIKDVKVVDRFTLSLYQPIQQIQTPIQAFSKGDNKNG